MILNLIFVGVILFEFEGTIDNVLSKRNVPLLTCYCRLSKQRSAFNHMTVMYKKSTVLRAGNYEDCPLMEDDMLWVRMLLVGAKCKNIDDYLVYARTGNEMIGRRGGKEYLKKYKNGRKKILNTGFISWGDYVKTIMIQTIVALLPQKLRFFIL